VAFRQVALIFDMDGVIVDSTLPHTQAWKLYLERNGVPADGIEHRMLGRRNDDIVRDFFAGRMLTENEVLRHGAQKEALYRELIAPDFASRLVPGIAQFLERHKNLPIGLATNAEPANVTFVLDAAGIRSFFQAIVDGHDVERPKPFPDVYLKAAQLLNVAPENCIVFEDSPTGVEAARAAEMRVVGLATTFSDLPGVDLLIQSFLDPEIESWLRTTTGA
jgi:beta-phosphoglucomutase